MVFSSITFLYYFLPVVLLVYFIVPRRCKNIVLLFASIIFYAWGEPKYIHIMGENVILGYVLLMLLSISIGYVAGLLMERYKEKFAGRLALWVALICCIGILLFFKYANFFIENIATLTGISLQLLDIALPVGVSFYTFQIVSYIIDVYRGDVKAQKNPIKLFTYVAMFPQLIAGPIVRYKDVEDDLSHREHSIPKIREGIVRFTLGLGKKVLVANQLGELVDIIDNTNSNSVLFMWTYAIAVSLQIYYDFSGYSDMAIGIGKILGFNFPENFDYPYISKSITEFWRRWHMTLGRWFRDYVYIPLGGSRVKTGRLVINLLIVWMLTGLWHGASWNFIVWGLYFGALLVIEKIYIQKYINKAKGFNHIYVLFAVAISFVIFSTDNLSQAFLYLKSMFGFGGLKLVTKESLYYLGSYGVTLFVAIIGATPLIKTVGKRAVEAAERYKLDTVLESVTLAFVLLVSTAHLVDGSFNPFLYFRF